VSQLATLRVEAAPAGLVAYLAGEIDASNAYALLDRLAVEAAVDGTALVLELSEVTYLDSAGVRLVYDLAAAAHRRNAAFRVVCPQGPIRGVLELAGVGRTLGLDDSLGQALAALDGSGA